MTSFTAPLETTYQIPKEKPKVPAPQVIPRALPEQQNAKSDLEVSPEVEARRKRQGGSRGAIQLLGGVSSGRKTLLGE